MRTLIRHYRHRGAHRPGGPRHLFTRPPAVDPWAGAPLFPADVSPARMALLAVLAAR
jgi:hypothetical protein